MEKEKKNENLAPFALVIPYCKKDMHFLMTAFKLWPSCNEKNEQNKNVDLVLLFSGNDLAVGQKMESVLKSILEKTIGPLFRNVFFMYHFLNKEQDVYPVAPAYTFFDFLLKDLYEAFFFCEVDCAPIKKNWIYELTKQMEHVVREDIWISGTACLSHQFAGNDDIALHAHLNGNGIFRARTDESKICFKETWDRLVEKSCLPPYDVFMFSFNVSHHDPRKKLAFLEHVRWTFFVANIHCDIETLMTFQPTEKCWFVHARGVLQWLTLSESKKKAKLDFYHEQVRLGKEKLLKQSQQNLE